MPLYDYKCEECEHVFSLLKKIDDRENPEKEGCPKCNKKAVKLQIGGASVMDSVRVFGLKPTGEFKERMSQIKHGFKHDRRAKFKD